MDYLQSYLERVALKEPSLAGAIKDTVNAIVTQYISNFSFVDHVVSLLVGDVQAGKTSHMFGVMAAAADEGFVNFVLLTTDNVRLQQQTYHRTQRDLCDFCVCDENDELKYVKNNLSKPAVIVLKKNSSVLKRWKRNFQSNKLCIGNPLFIVDDEADAASLNTKVNKKEQSTINKHLAEIKESTPSSIYMEVTGTPQSIILQSQNSGWKPYFVHYFKPGAGYLGGNFFFRDDIPEQIILTDNDEAADLLNDDEFPENGLKRALIMHLITAAQLLLTGENVCNFLIHPSMKIEQHELFAQKIGAYLNEIAHSYTEKETKDSFYTEYQSLKKTKTDILDFDELYVYIIEQLENDTIKILLLNSTANYEENSSYDEGINIIIGGNSLGRGITFPKLQTVYYCRVSKNPQADTMWQHARMFGYDRDPGLMRVYMPPKLYKLFSDINQTNNSIIKQIEKMGSSNELKLIYSKGIRPTRSNVIDVESVGILMGNVNYFPFIPENKDVAALDAILKGYEDGEYSIGLKQMIRILEYLASEGDDWNPKNFIGFLNALLANNPSKQGRLIIRRKRDIGKGTGTLLSPNDRALGDALSDEVVLTLYKITGNTKKGWDGTELWYPNIKLPKDNVYYSGE